MSEHRRDAEVARSDVVSVSALVHRQGVHE
jgi:hypothetical protein